MPAYSMEAMLCEGQAGVKELFEFLNPCFRWL